jgi:hypothetical protein
MSSSQAYNGGENHERYPVMKVDRLPVRVVSRIKGTAVCVELIGENEDHVAAIFIGWYIVYIDRRVPVD